MHKFVRRKILGISLLEVMLSLSIIAVIIIMATRYYGVAQTSSNVDETRHVIGNLVSALATYEATFGIPSGTGAAAPTILTLYNDGLLPASTCTSSTECNAYIATPFGNAATGIGTTAVVCGGTSTSCYTITGVTFNSEDQCRMVASGFDYATCGGTNNDQLTVPVK